MSYTTCCWLIKSYIITIYIIASSIVMGNSTSVWTFPVVSASICIPISIPSIVVVSMERIVIANRVVIRSIWSVPYETSVKNWSVKESVKWSIDIRSVVHVNETRTIVESSIAVIVDK